MTTTDRSLEELTVQTCVELASSVPIGRLAVAFPSEPPLVVPVNFVLDGQVVMFRTGAGQKLRWLRQQPASFEVDYIDYLRLAGWSVLFQGIAYEATPYEIATAGLEVEPWPGPRPSWIRLIPASITGRRIELHTPERDGVGYL